MPRAPDPAAEEGALLRRAARTFFAEHAPLERLAEAETGAADRARWRTIAELGWLEASAPGALATFAAELALEAGRALAPDPLVATLAIVRALAAGGDPLSLARDVIGGRHVVAPALAGSGGAVVVEADGRVSGTIAFVEGAHAADALLVGPTKDGWRLVEVGSAAVRLRPMAAIVGAGWSEVELRGAPSRAAGDAPMLVEIGAALQAAWTAGAASALLESTVAYVSERRQFGRAIGSFQAVQHTLASAAIAVDEARALACRALADLDGEAATAARYGSAVAFVGATDRFVDVARRCHQVWGGMGFSTETHVHHFSRRARLATQTWGGRDRWLEVIAKERLAMPLLRDRYARAGASPSPGGFASGLSPTGRGGGEPPPLDAFREEVRAFVERELDPVIPLQGPFPQADTPEKRVFLEKVGARGWLGLTWSPDYGGRGWGAEYQNVLHQELEYAGLPTASIESAMVGPTLARHGSEELKRRYLPAIASGALSVALGYSEPEAGSDLASLALRARRDGDEYVLDGQKMWTSAAHFAHVIWLAARTDPDVPKHRGISLFVVDADSPGITISAIGTMHDHRTNVVHFDGVRVPRSRLVGEENAGWRYLLEALDLERLTAFPVGNLRRDLDELTAWVRDTPLDGDPVVMRLLAEEAVAVEASLSHLDEAIAMLAAGELPSRPATMLKVAVTECRQSLANRVLETCGPRAALSRDDPRALLAGRFENAWRGEIVTTIAGGANEIQRDLIARRHLGLPRAE